MDGDNYLGMGPALPLVDATFSGDVENIRLLRAQFGNPQLATAAAQVSQRAMTLREDLDEELVMEVTHAPLAT